MRYFFVTLVALVIGCGLCAPTDVTRAASALIPFQLVGPHPVSITLSPSTVPNLLDRVPVGTLVSTATVTMSDNTTNYTGQLLVSDQQFAARGLQIVTAVASLTPDGSRNLTITAN